MTGWVLGLWLWGSAVAGPRVQLPLQEDRANWADALARAGMGLDGAAVDIWLIDDGAMWRVLVSSAAGERREARVSRPTTPAAREEVLALAGALLRSVDSPRAPSWSPPPPPAPVLRPAPKTMPAPKAQPAPPIPQPEPPTPVRLPPVRVPFAAELEERRWVVEQVAPPPPTVESLPPVEEPKEWRPPWMWAAGSLETRAGLEAGWSATLGVRPTPLTALALRVSPLTPLSDAGTTRGSSHGGGDLQVGPVGRALRSQVLAGVHRHGFHQQGQTIDVVWLGRLGGEVGLSSSGRWGRVGLVTLAAYDLGRIDLSASEGTSLRSYSPFSWSIGLSFDFFQRGDPRGDVATIPE